ncbi:hypothetical protein D3C75_655520 [compost metagenome]
MNYISEYHWTSSNRCLARDDGKVLVTTSGGYLALNHEQYDLLKKFDQQARYVEDVIRLYPEEYRSSISSFINLLIQKHVLIESYRQNKLTIFGLIRKIMFIPLPHKFLDMIVEGLTKYINLKFVTIISVAINTFGLIALFFLMNLTDFTIESVPRNITTFLIGFVAAILHEFWMAVYIKKSGKNITRWYFKIVFGLFVTLATNWSEMLLKTKRKRIIMFLFAINMTLCTSSLEALAGMLAWQLHYETLSSYLCMFSAGTLIFLGITLWPFLFKGDGYFLFQELTGVYRVRPRALRSIFFVFRQEQRRIWSGWKNREKGVLLTWAILFMVTLGVLEYLLYLGIRIII